MSKSVKEQALAVLETWWPGAGNEVRVGAIAAAGLLLDERAQACVEACKAFAKRWPLAVMAAAVSAEWRAVVLAGAAYDEPKVRTRDEIVAELVSVWTPLDYVPPKRSLRYEELLDELAASVKGERP